VGQWCRGEWGVEPDTAILLAAGRKHYLLGEKMKGIMRDESEIEQ
jgi:hypothetical protein